MIARRVHGEVVLRRPPAEERVGSADSVDRLLATAFAERATVIVIEAVHLDLDRLTDLRAALISRRLRLVVIGREDAALAELAGLTAEDDRVWFVADDAELDARLAEKEISQRITTRQQAPDTMLPYPRPVG